MGERDGREYKARIFIYFILGLVELSIAIMGVIQEVQWRPLLLISGMTLGLTYAIANSERNRFFEVGRSDRGNDDPEEIFRQQPHWGGFAELALCGGTACGLVLAGVYVAASVNGSDQSGDSSTHTWELATQILIVFALFFIQLGRRLFRRRRTVLVGDSIGVWSLLFAASAMFLQQSSPGRKTLEHIPWLPYLVIAIWLVLFSLTCYAPALYAEDHTLAYPGDIDGRWPIGYSVRQLSDMVTSFWFGGVDRRWPRLFNGEKLENLIPATVSAGAALFLASGINDLLDEWTLWVAGVVYLVLPKWNIAQKQCVVAFPSNGVSRVLLSLVVGFLASFIVSMVSL